MIEVFKFRSKKKTHENKQKDMCIPFLYSVNLKVTWQGHA